MLEADDSVIRVAHDNNVATGTSLPPLVDPQVVDVVEIDIGQERADYSPYAKGNFSFERVICDWRTGVTVLDLRLKK